MKLKTKPKNEFKRDDKRKKKLSNKKQQEILNARMQD